MKRIAIVGVGITSFGELWDLSLRDLLAQASLEAMANAGAKREQIDSIVVASMSPGLFTHQEQLNALAADCIGLTPKSAMHVAAACASGGVAIRTAMIQVASGFHDVVLVVGGEKMTDGVDETDVLSTAADSDFEGFHGLNFPGLYALMAQAHRMKYGISLEDQIKQMAAVSVKNHGFGTLNPKAQFPFPITEEMVLNSADVADPIKLLNCSPISDGAAAVIICPFDMADQFTGVPIEIIGSGQASDTIALHSRDDKARLKAVHLAGKQAYKMAGVGPDDIDLAQFHDCFSIAEIIASEELGFFEPGQGGQAVLDGKTSATGKLPSNTDGGLKSKGHPVGGTGVAQAVETVIQLRGDAGKRQVKGAKIGLTQNLGGSGGTAVVHIFQKTEGGES